MQVSLSDENLRVKISQQVQGEKKTVIIGDFVVEQFLGKGAYGEVYKGFHSKTGKQVALKLVDKYEMDSKAASYYIREKQRKLLETEDLLMRKCKSAHVVKCYQTIENDNYKILVLEYCAGQSLKEEIIRKGAISENEAIKILKQIIFGLSELHRNCIIHRDLKPDNIFIHNGIYKIGDMGFSKEIPTTVSVDTLTMLGTSNTMAPEVKNGQPYGLKADVWSLGIIFYVMICNSFDLDTRYKKAMGKEFFFRTIDKKQPSGYVTSFLEQVLVGQDKRLNWSEMLEHKMFKYRSSFGNSFVVDLPINTVPSDSPKVKIQKNEEVIEIDMSDQMSEKAHEQNVIRSSNQEKYIEPTIILPQEVSSPILDFGEASMESELYNKITFNNLECLKANFIFEGIVLEIESKQALNLQEREEAEFMTLLLHRCSSNISWAFEELRKEFKGSMLLRNYLEQIEDLRSKIQKKKQQYHQKLFTHQSKYWNVFSDKVKRIAKSKAECEKETMINGIEVTDFSKNDQIEYTYKNYITKMVNRVSCKNREHQKDITIKLMAYRAINHLKQQDLVVLKEDPVTKKNRVEELTFNMKVEEILMNQK